MLDGKWVDLFDNELFTRLLAETRLCLLGFDPIVEVLVEGVSSNYMWDHGYFIVLQIYQHCYVVIPLAEGSNILNAR